MTPVLSSTPGNLKGNGVRRTEKGEKSSKSVILAKSEGGELLPDPTGHPWNDSDPSQFCPHDSRQDHCILAKGLLARAEMPGHLQFPCRSAKLLQEHKGRCRPRNMQIPEEVTRNRTGDPRGCGKQ